MHVHKASFTFDLDFSFPLVTHFAASVFILQPVDKACFSGRKLAEHSLWAALGSDSWAWFGGALPCNRYHRCTDPQHCNHLRVGVSKAFAVATVGSQLITDTLPVIQQYWVVLNIPAYHSWSSGRCDHDAPHFVLPTIFKMHFYRFRSLAWQCETSSCKLYQKQLRAYCFSPSSLPIATQTHLR